MANVKLSAKTELTSVASGDFLHVVDVSDTTDGSSGTSKKMTKANLVTGIATTDITDVTSTAAELNILDGATLTVTELNYVDGVTSAIQTQMDLKAPLAGPTFTGTVVIPTPFTLGATSVTPTGTELNYVDGVTSAIQTQIDTKSPIASPEFTGDVGLATSANITVNSADPDMILELPAGSWSPTTTSGCAGLATVEAGTNDIDYKVLDFDTSSDENAFTNLQMPTNWDGGVVQFRYVWTNAGGSAAQTVTFELSGIAIADDGAIDQAVGTPIEVADTFLAQGDIHISAFSGDVTLAGSPAGGQWVHLELMRDVSEDDLSGDARLIGVQIKYKTNQYGQ